ncbi:MAG: hypothetical protein CL902_00635 [Dehalococcoidia bacterium]|nr:hypothetical protein [Dehalococcoidia bacterium]|tara:strand:- start:70 stop:666 length:597 start_codon:yes stop_codon:yes gene_type:complete
MSFASKAHRVFNDVHRGALGHGAIRGLLRRCRTIQDVKDVCSVLVHKAAKKDCLHIVETILQDLPDEQTATQPSRACIANIPRGSKDYTPLCQALYRGNIKMAKALIAAGADIFFVNTDGERLDDVIAQGKIDFSEKDRSNHVFIAEKYRQCRLFLEQRERWMKETEKRDTTVHPYWPRSAHKAGTKIQRWYRKNKQQ